MLNLHRNKIILVVLLLLVLCVPKTFAQRNTGDNLPGYDDRWLHYGFSVGILSSSVRVQYSDAFLDMDSLHSIMPVNTMGFSLGMIANVQLAQFLDFRLAPEIAFYQYQMDYNTISQGQSLVDRQTVEINGFVEFPVLLKYKSVRRDNMRMYLVGGVEPAINATGKKENEDPSNRVNFNKTNLSLQIGFGMDMYFPLFKFSPEIRYSRGLSNILANEDSRYHDGLAKVTTNTFTLYLLFE